MKNIPQSLYIHIPWCIRKCPYCDFNSHPLRGTIDEAAYIRHLLTDLAHDLDRRPIQTIFIGGGTPSLLTARHIATLLEGINRLSPLPANCEITLEANPGTFEQSKFADYRQSGINRLSIGIQSFDPVQLHALGRIHNRDEALRAVTIAEKAGFERINLDLMFALPGQTPAAAIADLALATALAPEHISWYQLTLEPGTAFHVNPPALPDNDTQTDIYEAGIAHLGAHGYHQYEISAWTAGEPCRHNLNYWQYGDYLGIGAGAHGKQSRNGAIIRSSKYRAPGAYQKAAGNCANPYCDQEQHIAREGQTFEFMMNALRLQNGVPTAYLTERSALTLDELRPALNILIKQGLMEVDIETRLKTTPRGFALLNNVLDTFLDS